MHNNIMDYKLKYIKYKNKYLNLLLENSIGGANKHSKKTKHKSIEKAGRSEGIPSIENAEDNTSIWKAGRSEGIPSIEKAGRSEGKSEKNIVDIQNKKIKLGKSLKRLDDLQEQLRELISNITELDEYKIMLEEQIKTLLNDTVSEKDKSTEDHLRNLRSEYTKNNTKIKEIKKKKQIIDISIKEIKEKIINQEYEIIKLERSLQKKLVNIAVLKGSSEVEDVNYSLYESKIENIQHILHILHIDETQFIDLPHELSSILSFLDLNEDSSILTYGSSVMSSGHVPHKKAISSIFKNDYLMVPDIDSIGFSNREKIMSNFKNQHKHAHHRFVERSADSYIEKLTDPRSRIYHIIQFYKNKLIKLKVILHEGEKLFSSVSGDIIFSIKSTNEIKSFKPRNLILDERKQFRECLEKLNEKNIGDEINILYSTKQTGDNEKIQFIIPIDDFSDDVIAKILYDNSTHAFFIDGGVFIINDSKWNKGNTIGKQKPSIKFITFYIIDSIDSSVQHK